ncbi:TldD/PmbA family protein [Clostridium botulinum]|nr:TldD/PmbA family protein [Clostridium botulinum]
MDIFKFQKELFQKGKQYGFNDMEIFYTLNSSTSIGVQKNTVKDYKIAETYGVSFRGIYMDKMGYSYVEKISEESIDFLLKEAMENAKTIEVDDEEELFEGAEKYETVNKYSEALVKIPVQELIESAFKLEKAALEADSRIKQVLECSISRHIYESAIINTKGMNCYSKGCIVSAAVYVMANDEMQTSTGFEYDFTLSDFSKLNFKNIAKKAVVEAVSKLWAESIQSGNYPVIFRHNTATELFASFISSFSGENVEKGFSILKGKLGQTIAGHNINVIENPLMEDAPGAEGFDAEGYPTKRVLLVKNGKLLNFMHNRKTSKKAGTSSTGNASKNGFNSTVTVGAHNVYLKPGDKGLEDIIKETQDGLFIIELHGTNAGINSVSGDFSLYAAGFLIEKGKLTHPVNQITVSGNIFKVMNNLDEIANDLIIKSSVTSPSVKVRSLSISGK